VIAGTLALVDTAMPWPAVHGPGWPDFRQAWRRVPPGVVRGTLVAGVLGILVLFGVAASLAPSAGMSAVIHMPPAGDLGTEPARAPCDGCGVVESIDRVEGIGGGPASYAFGVRMKDGSLRDSIATSADAWRVGDRIILMGGRRPPAAPGGAEERGTAP
jgi:hypothetical protein